MSRCYFTLGPGERVQQPSAHEPSIRSKHSNAIVIYNLVKKRNRKNFSYFLTRYNTKKLRIKIL